MSTLGANSHILCSRRDQQQQQNHHQPWSNNGGTCCLLVRQRNFGYDNLFDCREIGRLNNKVSKRDLKLKAFWPDMTRPTSVDMEPINDTDQLDQILLKAQELNQPILIDWMASWCRKCIYLKPKLEKLAAEYDSKTKIYCVDVNKVPQSLVKRGNVSKMPTIQLWKEGEMKAEVIGGHKAWLVIEEVREMIQKFI